MASFSETLIYTTTRIEVFLNNEESAFGTGFFFWYKQKYLFLVTNRHVVIDGDGNFVMYKAHKSGDTKSPLLGHGTKIPFKKNFFVYHPNEKVDVAVANISLIVDELEKSKEPVYWTSIMEINIPNDDQINNIITAIEDIIFIGYPDSIWDEVNLLPIVRKGITATPYYIDYENENQFLIDASVFAGSSGSPVFLFYPGGYSDKKGNFHVGGGGLCLFLGIISDGYYIDKEGDVRIREIPTQKKIISEYDEMLDLGVVVKPQSIIETIEHYLDIASIK